MTTAPHEQSPKLSQFPKIKHGFFGRRRDATPPQTDTNDLNVSQTLRQDQTTGATNRNLALAAADMTTFSLASAAQVHSTTVLSLTTPPNADARPQVDGFVTNLSGIALGIVTADCGPILFADAGAGVIGACHAGWKGAVGGIIGNTVSAMIDLGASPQNIVAVLGPTISGINYEVGSEFAETVMKQNPVAEAFFFLPAGAQNLHFDLPAFIAAEFQKLQIDSVEIIQSCTYANPAKYFSHRHFTHHNGVQGRQISLIGQLK